MSSVRNAVEKQDQEYLLNFFERGREYRNSIPNRASGLIQKVPAVYCDLVDEAGSIIGHLTRGKPIKPQ